MLCETDRQAWCDSRTLPRSIGEQYDWANFSFYNMLGKFAASIGRLMIALVKSATGSVRLSMFSIAVLFLVGGVLLTRVKEHAK
jgi:UMF1 family MFS transporter